jgi:pSer/pThr/pTyr-binding forkhead associated (FHA) protein
MQVKLKVLSGASAGKEVLITGKQLLIGRDEGCHLRPRSDSVSRRHCELAIEDSRVSVTDLGSRNGTVVNGETITETRVLAPGDKLRVGRLEFEVCIDYGLGGAKKPKVRDVKDAAARTARAVIGDEDITDWLEEGDEVDRARKLADPETRQFRLDETDRVALERASEPSAAEGETVSNVKPDETVDAESEVKEKEKKKKKPPGKLPKVPEQMSADTRTAAADTLRKFFNRR